MRMVTMKRTRLFTMRMSDVEYTHLQKVAKSHGETLSGLIRRLLRKAARRIEKG
jgi:hypothetical protein